MKKLTLLLLGLLLTAGPVWAAKVSDVYNTKHNLASTQPNPFWNAAYSALNVDEVCIFCHTPHGGSLDGPLWNRDLSAISPAAVFTHYSSETLSTTVGASNRAVNKQSLLCLSCHDGSIGVGDNLINNGGTVPDNTGAFFKVILDPDGISPGKRTGAARGNLLSTTDLSDDHPISFNYPDVFADATNAGALHTVVDIEAADLVLYNGASKTVECVTCHDPHVDSSVDADYKPFLRVPNTGSAMCLACHIK
ncbi:MAG TPA: hypothetical protein VIR78_09670 [Malonomonas sp.]